MSLVNYATREITCKIVYYGPGRSGKTTNLHYIYGQVPRDRKGQMVSLATQTDRTLFFDFLPLDLGIISGFTTRFQLYTVPGQVYYQATRKLVLQGADGVVFVADSQARQLEENIESMQDLHANLAEQGIDVRAMPLVIQYNKQDLPPDLILGVPELEDALNFRGVPSFAADALHGAGRVRDAARDRRAGAAPALSAAAPAGRPADGGTRSALPVRDLRRGAANRLAVTAARAVAQSPGTVYNPLFIYGSPGLGKTHLLMAVGHLAAASCSRSSRVEYLTLDEFVEELTPRCRRGTSERYRRRFQRRGPPAAGRRAVPRRPPRDAGELLRLFDALQSAGKQIVLTSDRPPGGDRRPGRAADHALRRRARHRRRAARLRDARGDPARASARSAASTFERGRARRGRALQLSRTCASCRGRSTA